MDTCCDTGKREAEQEWGKKNGDDGQEPDHDLRPKNDGTYIVEFKTADGEALAISVPASRAVRAGRSVTAQR